MRLPLTIAIMLALIGATFAAPTDLVKAQTQMVSPAVKISDNCSGQVVYSNRDKVSGDVTTLILTAKHCVVNVSPADIISISVPVYSNGNELIGEKVSYAKVIAKDSTDLALIELLDRQTLYDNISFIESLDNRLVIGEECFAVGFPMAGSLTVSGGLVGPLERQDTGDGPTPYLRATAQIAKGSSGGALYRYTGGEYMLIGIATARSKTDAFIGLWTPLSSIVPFLEKNIPE